MPHHTLLTRLRAEYLEMPGLRLTLDQAQRLCGGARALCKAVLDALVADGFLCVKSGRTYARVSDGAIARPHPVKAVSGSFDVEGFLRCGSVGTTRAVYQPRDRVFSQGDASATVMYLQNGLVKLSVLSPSGHEAVVALLETGAFFGESALVGERNRHETATAMTTSNVLSIPKEHMLRLLHEEHAFSSRFIAHMLARNIRIEQDMVDQFFNSSEKRLARTLLLLAHYGTPRKPRGFVPPLSQQTLADMVGTTRSRVNFFLNRFKKGGHIEYSGGGLNVNASLATVIRPAERSGPLSSEQGLCQAGE